jgi:hypothetical protein
MLLQAILRLKWIFNKIFANFSKFYSLQTVTEQCLAEKIRTVYSLLPETQ